MQYDSHNPGRDPVVWSLAILKQHAQAAYGGAMRPRVYISGPITKGQPTRSFNLYQSLDAQKRLIECSYAPFNPMLTMLHPDEPNIPHTAWMETDLPWVACADMILRLPGDSKGGDLETAYAERLDIPVFTLETFPWNQSTKAAA